MHRTRVGRERGGARRRSRRGVTIIEVLIVMTILALAASMFASTVASVTRQRTLNRDNALVADAVQSILEAMRNEDLALVQRLYGPDPFDDPDGPGTAPGHLFAIEGLEALPGTAGQNVGEIVLPVVNMAPEGEPADWQVREDAVIEELGMPRDLNGDSMIDGEDHALDYVILPVLVRLVWKGSFGPREFRMHTMLTELRP